MLININCTHWSASKFYLRVFDSAGLDQYTIYTEMYYKYACMTNAFIQ